MMIIKLAAAPVFLALSGCQTAGNDANIYGSLNGQRIAGNATYVSVSNVWNDADALPLAETHCGQFGKVARFNHAEGYRMVFDCVAR